MTDDEIMQYVFADATVGPESISRLSAVLKELRAEAEAAFSTGWDVGHNDGYEEGYAAGATTIPV